MVDAQVKYVDYGTVEDVKVADLRYLHRDYAVLPALCFRAKLHGIRPRKESLVTEGEIKYSRDVSTEFYEYVNNKDLQAEFVDAQVRLVCGRVKR